MNSIASSVEFGLKRRAIAPPAISETETIPLIFRLRNKSKPPDFLPMLRAHRATPKDSSIERDQVRVGLTACDPVPPKHSIALMQLTFRVSRSGIIRHVRSVFVTYRSRYFGV